MKVVSLFSGAGGLDLGLKQAGHEIILQCESDPGAQQVLKNNFPGILLLPDVCGLNSLPKETELLVAGFPCIDISRAGLRRGFDGQSSGLVRHIFRLLDEARDNHRPVPWVLLENVEALLDRNRNGSPFVKSITDTLEVLGYSSWAQRVICSAGFGVPNRRSRVFILASYYADARDILLAQGQQICIGSCSMPWARKAEDLCYECYQDLLDEKTEEQCSFALDLGNARSSPGVDVVPTFTTHNDRICLLLESQQMGMLRIEDAERLQGFPVGFTRPCYPIQLPGLQNHKIRPVKDNEIDVWESKRYALLGNAVTVQVSRWLGERLAAPYVFKYVPCDRDRPMPELFQNPHIKQDINDFDELDFSNGFEGGLLMRSVTKPHHKPMLFEGNGEESEKETSSNQDNSKEVKEELEEEEEVVEEVEEGQVENLKLKEMSEKVVIKQEEGEEIELEEANESRRGIRRYYTGDKDNYQMETWPRAAWFVRGIGRFGIEDMSECPRKISFLPLGKFITEVGKIPGPDTINTYIMRLREQGWNVENIVKKATSCGMKLIKEVSQVVRLNGENDEMEQIGELVWCLCKVTKLWWPGELLDPFNLPAGRTLPPTVMDNLSQAEKKAWLPSDLWGEPQNEKENSEDFKEELRNLSNDVRKVVVIFFGDGSHSWVHATNVLNFENHLSERMSEAEALQKRGNLKRPKLFYRAVDQAKIWLEVKTKKSKRGYISAVASRAATMAAAENRRAKCGNCEACLNRSIGGKGFYRRCLYVRAQCAAAAGHVGGQLSVHCEKAIGARIEVYWPLDQNWFPGTVWDFDRIRLRHQVVYDDGDREIIALWSPCQLIRVLNKQEEWPEEARLIEKKKQEEKEKEKHKKITRQEEMLRMQQKSLTSYEAAREERIQRNKSLFSSIFGSDECTTIPVAAGLTPQKNTFDTPHSESRNSTSSHSSGDYESKSTVTDTDLNISRVPLATATSKQAPKKSMKVNEDEILSMFSEMGGPVRRTRRAKRELEKMFFESIESEEKRSKNDDVSEDI